MAFLWSSKLETGFQKIDAQHRKRVDHFNTMIKACREAK